jgi:hypothetical protein
MTIIFERNSISFCILGDSLYIFRNAHLFYPLGDYDLKVMRQEYYINRQKAVCLATMLTVFVCNL